MVTRTKPRNLKKALREYSRSSSGERNEANCREEGGVSTRTRCAGELGGRCAQCCAGWARPWLSWQSESRGRARALLRARRRAALGSALAPASALAALAELPATLATCTNMPIDKRIVILGSGGEPQAPNLLLPPPTSPRADSSLSPNPSQSSASRAGSLSRRRATASTSSRATCPRTRPRRALHRPGLCVPSPPQIYLVKLQPRLGR